MENSLEGFACLLDEEDADLPFDLEFRVQGEDNQTQSIKAHKWPLAASSAVFRKQFFGTMAQTAERPVEDGREIVEIKDFTFNIMDRMVKMVYSRSMDMKECKDILEAFEMYKLFDKYEMNSQMRAAKRRLDSFDISTENLVEAIQAADEYRDLANLEDLCQAFITRCALSVHKELKGDYTRLFKILAEKLKKPELYGVIIKELSTMDSVRCDNCKEVLNKCRKGQKVDYLDEGQKISVNGYSQVVPGAWRGRTKFFTRAEWDFKQHKQDNDPMINKIWYDCD